MSTFSIDVSRLSAIEQVDYFEPDLPFQPAISVMRNFFSLVELYELPTYHLTNEFGPAKSTQMRLQWRGGSFVCFAECNLHTDHTAFVLFCRENERSRFREAIIDFFMLDWSEYNYVDFI